MKVITSNCNVWKKKGDQGKWEKNEKMKSKYIQMAMVGMEYVNFTFALQELHDVLDSTLLSNT
jgi:hypothetical protein